MPLLNLFLIGAFLPPAPPAITEPAPCPTPPEYTYSDWEMYWEERRFEEQWVTQRLHYSRTRWDECRGTGKTQTKVEGPFRLWEAVPENRVADVSRPEGPTEGLSGAPLRSSGLPGGAPAVGPLMTVPAGGPAKAPGVPVASAPTPFFPGFAFFVGALVATWIFRPRKTAVAQVGGHDLDPVQGPPLPRDEARTLASIKAGEEWVPTPTEAEWLQAFFGIEGETGYGPRTQEAVMRFQREHGITPDPEAMVGINTYRALHEEHLARLDEHWQRRAEGRWAPSLDSIFASPMPPDLRDEMMKRQEAYAAYWAAVEGRYQAIKAGNVSLVERLDEEISALKGSGIKLGDILVLKETHDPLAAFSGDPRGGQSASAKLGIPTLPLPTSLPGQEQKTPSPTTKQFWTLATPMANAKLTTAYGVVDASHEGGHTGIDLVPVTSSKAVLAAASGTVVSAQANGNYGNCVIIDHHNGYFTVYGHLDSIEVKAGSLVNPGDELGIMGNTGRSEGAHLHFELRSGQWDAAAKDPLAKLAQENPWLFLEASGWGTNFRRLIEDSEFKDTRVSLDEIRNVLRKSPTFKNYADGAEFPVYVQKGREGAIEDSGRKIDVAQVILDAACNATAKDGSKGINPILLLARLEVESSLLTELRTPTSDSVIWAMGYGAPDSGNRDYRHTGLDYQIQRAATRLAELFHGGDELSPPDEIEDGPVLFKTLQPQGVYSGKLEDRTSDATVVQGNTTTIIPRHIGVENRATWALYRYTPHMVDLHLIAASQNQKQTFPDWYSDVGDGSLGGGNLRFVRVWKEVNQLMGR